MNNSTPKFLIDPNYQWDKNIGTDMLRHQFENSKYEEKRYQELGVPFSTDYKPSNEIIERARKMQPDSPNDNNQSSNKISEDLLDDDREEGLIYLTGHRVGGIGPLHTAYEYKSAEMQKPETISAVNHEGRLVAGYNNETDNPEHNMTLGILSPQIPYSYDSYWQLMKDSAFDFNKKWRHYPNDASLLSDEKNSNSFTEGLGRCTGGVNSYDMDSLVGGNDYFSCNEYYKK